MAAPHTLSSSADSLEKQFYEIALALFEAEQSLPEEDRPDNIQVDFDTEGLEVQISSTLNIDLNTSGPSVTFTAKNYLI